VSSDAFERCEATTPDGVRIVARAELKAALADFEHEALGTLVRLVRSEVGVKALVEHLAEHANGFAVRDDAHYHCSHGCRG
jgi:hypothetical protein